MTSTGEDFAHNLGVFQVLLQCDHGNTDVMDM